MQTSIVISMEYILLATRVVESTVIYENNCGEEMKGGLGKRRKQEEMEESGEKKKGGENSKEEMRQGEGRGG